MAGYSEKTAAAVINSMLNYTRRNDKREALWYSWRDADGRQCAIDGYRAFRLAGPLDSLPEMPEYCTPINLARVFALAEEGELRELAAPALADVEALIAYDRKCPGPYRYMYMFGKGLPVVNASFLRDALKVFPDARLFYRDNIHGIIFKSAYGEGLVLPIRVDDEKRGRREIIYNLSTFAARFTV